MRTLALNFQLRVPSFDVQAELLKKALMPHYDQIVVPVTQMYGQHFTTWFVFTPACGGYLLRLGMIGSMIRAQRVMYVTAEGIPPIVEGVANLLNSPIAKWTILAVSEFSKEMLTKAGVHVDGVVHHAIDVDEPYRAQLQTQELEHQLRERFKDRILFAYTGSAVARKKPELFIPAFREAYEKCGHKIALIAFNNIARYLDPNDTWCLTEHVQGSMPHEYVTAIHSACDFYLWPTVCEGFGVPPLEAMACGKPVIAGKFPPSTEYMNDYTTLWFPCETLKEEDYGMEQLFQMHYYKHEDLVNAILQAVHIKTECEDTYNSMCSAALDQAKRYDYRIIYGKELRKYLA
jgi:glycosyltransferase involved in cell wall biosynthesis